MFIFLYIIFIGWYSILWIQWWGC